MKAFTACLLVLFGCAAAVSGQCVPKVDGVDQSPTSPDMYGKCSSALESGPAGLSHWCKFGRLGLYPGPPAAKAQKCSKFGRASIYRGPIYGSGPGHKGACKRILRGSDEAAMIAVSTKYLKTYQSGWAADQGACGKCMCVRLHGADSEYNKGLQKEYVRRHMGLSFLGKVGDRCAECPDDSIDIMLDRPFSYAPFDPNRKHDNPNAPYVNAKPGVRGFEDPAYVRGAPGNPEGVGTWLADWQWVPCDWTHAKCADLWKSLGYVTVNTPKMTGGIDSYTMRPADTLRAAFEEPFRKERNCKDDPCED